MKNINKNKYFLNRKLLYNDINQFPSSTTLAKLLVKTEKSVTLFWWGAHTSLFTCFLGLVVVAIAFTSTIVEGFADIPPAMIIETFEMFMAWTRIFL